MKKEKEFPHGQLVEAENLNFKNTKVTFESNEIDFDRKRNHKNNSKNKNWFFKSIDQNLLFWKIARKILKVFLEFLIIAWIVVTLVFFLINATPGKGSWEEGLSAEQVLAIKKQYGLDLPLIQRYFNYLWGIIRFDFGVSVSLRPSVPINDFIWERFLISFSVGIFSVFLTLIVGIPLGIWVGKNPGKFIDNFSTIVISILSSVPSLVFALLLLSFGQKVGIPYIFNIQDFATFILPAVAMATYSVIIYVKYIRTELNNELNSMHAKFAYLKGLTRNGFVWKHALKASLFPIATFFPAVVLGSFVGSIFVEKIFLITGSGGIMVGAIESRDFNVILFLVIVYSLMTIISYTLRDILYEVLDPRIRRGGK